MEKTIKLNQLGIIADPIIINKEVNGIEYQIQTQIPYEQIFDMIGEVVNIVIDDRTFVSAPLQKLTTELLLVKYYTNIDMDVFDKENLDKHEIYETYDILITNGVLNEIKNNVDSEQLQFYLDTSDKTLHSIIDYKNSFKGILDMTTNEAASNSKILGEALNLLSDKDKLIEAKRFVERAENATGSAPMVEQYE